MRALLINAVCGIRSTGRICTDTAKELESAGYEVKIAYGRESVPPDFERYAVRIGNEWDVRWHALMTRLFDDRGYWSRRATKRFLQWAEAYDPDLLWLHNLHDYFINYEMLFEWIKSRPQMQVKWTMHDCWAFTGGCMHFMMADCYQWKTQCEHCPACRRQKRFRRLKEAENFARKKAAFCGVPNMTIVAVSHWMAGLVADSFLADYPVEVRHNTIDTSVFKPTDSDFRRRYGLEDKIVLLGVATAWGRSKGWYDFLRLADTMDDRFALVMVGLSDKQLQNLPERIVGIARTNSVSELAAIYTAADVFLNLTYEDTYPTVNLESQACGTPCITYRTGGSPESVPPENVVEQGDLDGVLRRVNELLTKA